MALISGWGRIPRTTAPVEYPIHPGAVSPSSLYHSLARGLGRSYGDASLPSTGGRSINTQFLNHFLSFDPETGILEAEPGVSLHQILEVLIPKGWFLPVTPGTQWVTLGGAVASNVHGKNHHHCGSIENFITRLEVATPVGVFVCGPDENRDLFRATVGGYGLTGIITRIQLKMKRVSSSIRSRTLRCKNLNELFEGFRRNDQSHEYSVAWVDTLSRNGGLGRGILFLGNHHDDEKAKKTPPGKPRLQVHFAMPSGLLNPSGLRLFNSLYYHTHRSRKESVSAPGSFFYPLDQIGNWNLLYGAQGFYQYQCALPDPDAERGIEECLRFLARRGLGSFLSVLKRCGDDTVLLPFCRKGFTLAIDIPNRGSGTLQLLDDLDRIVLEHGGRIYLTKDARLSADVFKAMYPEWKAWMKIVQIHNPGGTCRSLLSERLKLWDA